MEDRFEDLRNDVRIMLPEDIKEILISIINELEKVHNEIRQGFTRPG